MKSSSSVAWCLQGAVAYRYDGRVERKKSRPIHGNVYMPAILTIGMMSSTADNYIQALSLNNSKQGILKMKNVADFSIERFV